MTPDVQPDVLAKIHEQVLDSLDEEVELEMEDDGASKGARGRYFRDLVRLQAELIKLQDWVVARKVRIVVLFEGRDAMFIPEEF